MKQLLFALACALLLSACVTEEGARKHAARQHAAEVSDGLTWSATIYSSQRKDAKTETIGEFSSRTECMHKAMMHIKEKGYTDAAYSCGA